MLIVRVSLMLYLITVIRMISIRKATLVLIEGLMVKILVILR